MQSSLLSRDPVHALRVRETRITLVPSESDERPSIQVVDPSPQNLVINSPLEVMGFLQETRRLMMMPRQILIHDDQDQPVADAPVEFNAGRVVLNFTNLGSATAAFILLVCGYSPAQINWSTVENSKMLSESKAPEELEAFLRWHLL